MKEMDKQISMVQCITAPTAILPIINKIIMETVFADICKAVSENSTLHMHVK